MLYVNGVYPLVIGGDARWREQRTSPNCDVPACVRSPSVTAAGRRQVMLIFPKRDSDMYRSSNAVLGHP